MCARGTWRGKRTLVELFLVSNMWDGTQVHRLGNKSSFYPLSNSLAHELCFVCCHSILPKLSSHIKQMER